MLYSSADTIDDLFLSAIEELKVNGRRIAPRGMPTIEMSPALLELRDPRSRVLLVEGRSINPAFAIAEALWILSGSDDSWIYQYNSRLKAYADQNVLRGAYGPRLRRWAGTIDQLDIARRLLIADPSTRRAVIQIYDPAAVSPMHSDIPCTIGYRFLIRDGKLDMFTTMRSQDIWLGFPYDVFSNTLLQELMAGWVGVSLGRYYHSVDSLHLYDRDFDSAQRIKDRARSAADEMEPLAITWDSLPVTISSVLEGDPTLSGAFHCLAVVLNSYRYWKQGRQDEALELAAGLNGALGEAARRWYDSLRRVIQA